MGQTKLNYVLTSSLQSLEEIPLPDSNKVGISNFIALLCPMKSIVCVSSTATTISMLLPQENVEGRLVPTFFRDRPKNYYMFLISTLYAVVGAFSALLIPHKPKVKRLFRIYAVASMLLALAIVLYAAALCRIQAYGSANVFQRPKIPQQLYGFFFFFLVASSKGRAYGPLLEKAQERKISDF